MQTELERARAAQAHEVALHRQLRLVAGGSIVDQSQHHDRSQQHQATQPQPQLVPEIPHPLDVREMMLRDPSVMMRLVILSFYRLLAIYLLDPLQKKVVG
jgi:hypothetical protein